jgi:hypothetical protein
MSASTDAPRQTPVFNRLSASTTAGDLRFQNRSEPVPNRIGSAVPTLKGGTASEPLTGTDGALPFGLSREEGRGAVTAT